MKLSQHEKQQILAGNMKTLLRKGKPACEPGDEFTLSVSRPRPYTDPETKHVFRPPAERSAWITVTSKVRRAKGGWAVYFNVTDNRHPTYFMAKGGGYTTDVSVAVDKLAADVDAATQARISAEARQVNADRRARDAELAERDRRRQERAFRTRLRETLQGLDPAAQMALLAALEREMAEALRMDEAA